MDGQGGILRLCRLCLVKDQVNIPIFEQQGDTRQIFLKISSCLAVKISREDKLPKNICEGCSDKLDSVFEFWNSSANAEKTLLSWLEQEEEKTGLIDQIPIEGLAKEETETLKNVNNETDPLPRKRARHTAAVKAQINITQELEDLITTQSLTKMEDESEVTDGEDKDPSYTEIPDNSDEDHQAGPSGVGKDGVESSDTTYACVTCGCIFNKPWRLQHHLESLNIQLELYCHICDEFWDVDSGTTCSHTSQLEVFHCKFCRNLIDPEISEQHICFHQNAVKEKRQRSAPYICSYCKKEYGKYSYLQFLNHEKKHQKLLKPATIQCKKCNLKFETEKEKASHKYRFHKRVPMGVCDICGLATKHIARHRAVHMKERPFQCGMCPKTFRASYGLKKHMLIHSDEAKHQCKVCGKSFKFSYNLTVHMRIHDNVKPFECSACNKTFTTKQWRDRHAQTHCC